MERDNPPFRHTPICTCVLYVYTNPYIFHEPQLPQESRDLHSAGATGSPAPSQSSAHPDGGGPLVFSRVRGFRGFWA